MRYLKQMLLPFSWLYGFIMYIRKQLYAMGILKSFRFDIPVIVVGNLTIGGTGKTPMVEYILRLLKDKYKVATLSRGYKRKTKGFRIAGPADNATTMGDEPIQFYYKFRPEVKVAVGEDRVYSIPFILKDHPETEILLLDDAYQHRRLKASFQVLITDYYRLFFKDFIIPAGLLRESRKGAERADVIVVSKCPQSISKDEKLDIILKVQRYAGSDKSVYFSYIHYEAPKALGLKKRPIYEQIILVTGIANPDPLKKYLETKYKVIKHFRYPDHHFFTLDDIKIILAYFDQANDDRVSILFTEKDLYRIINTDNEKKLTNYPVYFQPITYKFVEYGEEFDNMIFETIRQFTN